MKRRTVAIKVLSAHLSDNAEMKARFDREAQTIACVFSCGTSLTFV